MGSMIYGFISFLVQEERKNIDLSCNRLLENGGIKSEIFLRDPGEVGLGGDNSIAEHWRLQDRPN